MNDTDAAAVDAAYRGRTVLITGGAGAIGSRLTARLLEAGAQVVVLDSLTSGYEWNMPVSSNLLFIQGDILDDTALKRVFFQRPSVVFHLAAFFANQNSVDYPERDLMANGVGMLRVLQYSTLVDVDRVVFASSSSIYGSEPPLPVTEDISSTNLSTPYQITKKLGEYYSDFFHKHHGLPVVKARFFNSYGPGEVPGQYRNVIPNFFYWSMNGRALPITGSGEESRDFTYVGDTVDGLLRCGVIDAAIGEAFNLAAGRDVQIRDLAQRIIELTGNEAGIEFLGRRKWDGKARFVASNDKAREVLGFEPKVSIEEGLVPTHQWFIDNWDDIAAAAQFGPGQSSALRG